MWQKYNKKLGYTSKNKDFFKKSILTQNNYVFLYRLKN